MTQRKFYETVFTVRVLSEEPLPADLTLDQLAYGSDEGYYVPHMAKTYNYKLDGQECANLLIEFSAVPGYFRLDNCGDDLED